jgi:hypothetical protein
VKSRVTAAVAFGVLVAALSLAPAPVAAQGTTAGVQGGISFANLKLSASSATITLDNRLGGVVGFFVAHDFNKGFGLQFEANYIQKGTKSTDTGGEGKLDIRVDYLEIPVLARVNLKASNTVTVRLFGGPAFAAKLTDKQTLAGVDLDEDSLQFKSYDVGLTIGGAVEFGKVFLDGRYTWGLIDVEDAADQGEATVKNKAFTFMVGFRFK